MVDFLDHGARDPILYSDYSKSYFNFVAIQEDGIAEKMNGPQRKLLELFSNEIIIFEKTLPNCSSNQMVVIILCTMTGIPKCCPKLMRPFSV